MILLAAIAFLALASAAMAVTRRNLIHAALWFVVTWFGVAMFFLWAGAQFIGLAQVLVYVGAVSMIVLFAMLLTRQGLPGEPKVTPSFAKRFTAGFLIVSAVFGLLAGSILGTSIPESPGAPSVSIAQLGKSLMGQNVIALLAIGGLLTVALIGAVYIASSGSEDSK